MPNLNMEFTDKEYNDLLQSKLAKAQEEKKDLNWHDFFVLVVKEHDEARK
jgi:hypothetical protein